MSLIDTVNRKNVSNIVPIHSTKGYYTKRDKMVLGINIIKILGLTQFSYQNIFKHPISKNDKLLKKVVTGSVDGMRQSWLASSV